MRKRFISVCIAAILVYGIYGCAQTAKYTPIAEMGNVETEDKKEPDAEDAEESPKDENVTINVNIVDNDDMGGVQDEDESISNMPEIEIVDDCIVEARIHNKEEYEGFVSRLEEFTGCHYLWIDLGKTDTTIYLDEILDLRDFEYLQVRNGGNVSARDKERCAYFEAEIELSHVFAIDEDMLSYITSNDSYGQSKIVIELDNQYRRKLPIEELLNYQNCANVILVWDDDTDGEGLLDVQEDMESLKEWDYLQSVQEAEGGSLKAIYRLNDVDYSYTGYEFYDYYKGSKEEIQTAFICIKDREGNGAEYFDIIDIPVEKFTEPDSLDRVAYHWLDISDDLNLDGYRDLVFRSRNDGTYLFTFLWDKEEERFIFDESAVDSFGSGGTERYINTEVHIQAESYIDTEQVISDFLCMDSIEFQKNYDVDDLYQRGILYCGREAWIYDGLYQEDYHTVENITAIRFYNRQPVPVYLNMNIGDRPEQYEGKISIDYHGDYAVCIYSKPADNGCPCIQEISFVKMELFDVTASKDLYHHIESHYYGLMEDLIGKEWILSPDGEKAVYVSLLGLPKLPTQIFIWHKGDKPYTIFRRGWWHDFVGWIDNDHLVCYHMDGYPILVHLERNEIEEITSEKGDFYTDGAKYSIQGNKLIGQFVFEEQYQWEILENDGEIYVVESG